MDDILSMFGGGRQRAARGDDVTGSVSITFAEAVRGTERSFGLAGRTITARFPAGVSTGQKIRLRGKGMPGRNGGPAGDANITVSVEPHPIFTIDKNNLRVAVPVSFPELALGATVEVPTFEGKPVSLKIPAGTPNGRTLRVKGKGIAAKAGTGDLLVTLQLVIPQNLNKEAEQAIKAFAEATKDADVRAGWLEEA